MTWLTPQQVAERVGCDVDLVYQWINSKKLPASDISRRGSKRPAWRVSEADLTDFMQSRKADPKPLARPPLMTTDYFPGIRT